MILEAIVTTRNDDGSTNLAPMGPRVEPGMDRFLLRPYRTARTYHNLRARPEGVLHVTDDALLIARAAVGLDASDAPLGPAARVDGRVLLTACRYYEFRAAPPDESDDRAGFAAVTVHRADLRPFFGFNRAKHAVVEAAILATRTEFLPLRRINREFLKHAETVRKTGGPDESLALRLLDAHVAAVARARGLPWKEAAP